MVQVRRNNYYDPPTNLRSLFEQQRVREAKIGRGLLDQVKILEDAIRDQNLDLAYKTTKLIEDFSKKLAKSLYHSAYLHGRINSARQTAESQRFDYSRCTGFPD